MKENEEEKLNEEINENVEMVELSEDEENDVGGGSSTPTKWIVKTVRGKREFVYKIENTHNARCTYKDVNTTVAVNSEANKNMIVKISLNPDVTKFPITCQTGIYTSEGDYDYYYVLKITFTK